MRSGQALRTFLTILEAVPDNMPLARFLPHYFRQNKQMGSSDRKMAGRLLYAYFRLGRASADLPAEERLFLSLFLCGTVHDPFLDDFRPDLNNKIGLPLSEKVMLMEEGPYKFYLEDVFPFHSHLTEGIDKQAFLSSFFIQPDLFIRLYPGKAFLVKSKLNTAEIAFKEEDGYTLRLPNGTKLNHIFDTPELLFEVQDLSSQVTGKLFQPQKDDYWWDACAGSGGKSLLLYGQQPGIRLLVSDIRESILDNLDERFTRAGLTRYLKKELDLTMDPDPVLHHFEFDGIVLDAPCTGSGTWGRTPEMISRFDESAIAGFQKLQQNIAANVIKYLKPEKPLIYITCSVFEDENEAVVDYMIKKLGMKLETAEVLKGYENGADTMFAARLIKK